MRVYHLKLFFLLSSALLFMISCTSPIVETRPKVITDISDVTITCNASTGNKGLLNFSGPVYVHLGLITDSSIHPNDWRYVKFKWGSTEKSAIANLEDKNKWSYKIPNIRRFFNVSQNEKILELVILFREGNCIDTLCKVLRNADKTDIHIPISPRYDVSKK